MRLLAWPLRLAWPCLLASAFAFQPGPTLAWRMPALRTAGRLSSAICNDVLAPSVHLKTPAEVPCRCLTVELWQRPGTMALGMAGGSLDNGNADGYHDSNEVDRTTMEGQVTKLGERISWTTDHDIVRGEVIEDATAESDVAEAVWQAEYIAAFGVIFLRLFNRFINTSIIRLQSIDKNMHNLKT
jgi:hypothetical protein